MFYFSFLDHASVQGLVCVVCFLSLLYSAFVLVEKIIFKYKISFLKTWVDRSIEEYNAKVRRPYTSRVQESFTRILMIAMYVSFSVYCVLIYFTYSALLVFNLEHMAVWQVAVTIAFLSCVLMFSSYTRGLAEQQYDNFRGLYKSTNKK